MYLAAGSPEQDSAGRIQIRKIKAAYRQIAREVAKLRGKDPIDTIMDLISEDESRIDAIYFLMSEENVRKEYREAMDFVRFG